MSLKNTGKVLLVGAGPGDPGLVTVKAVEALSSCDAVVYDNLIPESLVSVLPPRIARHYVGKLAAKHALSQDGINELLVTLANEGKTVVRLKGGDPFVFGRGGEEARYLHEHGIPFEIVPGVTSGVAGPAYAGIPVTDRDLASQVLFVTGHKSAEKSESSVDWNWVAKMTKGTVVIYMGVSEVGEIVAQLLEGGMSPDTPAAAVERGTFPTQRLIKSTLRNLSNTVEREHVKPPALFVIGDAVALSDVLKWWSDKPLFGKRILVTRPSHQAQDLYDALQSYGAEVLPYPTIAIEEAYDKAAWDAIKRIDSPNRWLVFTSENGVEFFLRQWMTEKKDVRLLADYKIAAVGTGTARSLNKHHLPADFVPTKATTSELAVQMKAALPLKDAVVVRVRGNLGDDTVEDTLREAGAKVHVAPVYQTYNPVWPDYVKARLTAAPPDVIFFTSGSSVDGFVKNLSAEQMNLVAEKALILSIGPMTTRIIESHGLKVGLEATTHSIPAMVEELLAHYRTNSEGRA